MSVDKLVDSTQLDSDLTSVANAIRTKGGTSAQLAFPAGFVSAINAISGGGGAVQYKEGTFTGDGTNHILVPIGFVPDLIYFWQSDESTLKKRINKLFSVKGIGAGGNYYSSDSATSTTKASVIMNPDLTQSDTSNYIWSASATGFYSRVSSAMCATGVEYGYKAWKFM